jgi:hypothetical protein
MRLPGTTRLKFYAFPFLILLFLVSVGPTGLIQAAEQKEVYEGLTGAEFLKLMKDNDYKVKEGSLPDTFVWTLQRDALIHVSNDKNYIYFYSEYPDYKLNLSEVNGITQMFMLPKVYLNSQGIVTLDAILDMKGGVTLERVKNFIIDCENYHNTMEASAFLTTRKLD